jgi:hypothetical protein
MSKTLWIGIDLNEDKDDVYEIVNEFAQKIQGRNFVIKELHGGSGSFAVVDEQTRKRMAKADDILSLLAEYVEDYS